MVCKKCGCDALIHEGDWLRCPNCGASFFDIGIDDDTSVTKQIDIIENQSSNDINKNSTPNNEIKTDDSAIGNLDKNIESDDDISNNTTDNTATTMFKNTAKISERDQNIATEPSTEIPAEPPQGEENESNPGDEEVFDSNKEQNSNNNISENKEERIQVEDKSKKKRDKKSRKNTKPNNSEISTDSNDGVKVKKSGLRNFVEFMIPIVIAVILALLLKTFVFANAVVPTGSMSNTIEAGDRVIASRLSYISSEPERYDIIIFSYPDDEEQAYVKRVIGLPGETITIIKGVVYYSDSSGRLYKADSSYITTETPTGDYGPFYIPYNGEIISVSGDYCYAENGSQVGNLDFLDMYCTQDESTGDYVVSRNLYFCMGDNRNDSHDSRFWNNKYVAEDKIIGKVMFRYYPSIDSIN